MCVCVCLARAFFILLAFLSFLVPFLLFLIFLSCHVPLFPTLFPFSSSHPFRRFLPHPLRPLSLPRLPCFALTEVPRGTLSKLYFGEQRKEIVESDVTRTEHHYKLPLTIIPPFLGAGAKALRVRYVHVKSGEITTYIRDHRSYDGV